MLNLIGLALISSEPGTNLAVLLELLRNYPAKTNEESRMMTLILKIGNTTWNSIYDRYIDEEELHYIFVNYCRASVPRGALDMFVDEFVNTEVLCCLFKDNIMISAHSTDDEALIHQYRLGYSSEDLTRVYLDNIDFLKHKQALAEH
jgi:hypothetical protein